MSTSVLVIVDDHSVQSQARAALKGFTVRVQSTEDFLVSAPTGAGKTEAFVVTTSLDCVWKAKSTTPGCRSILLFDRTAAPDLREVLRAGVDRALKAPDELSQLPDILNSLQPKQAGSLGHQGITVAVYSGTGGLGRTTLACALAQRYASKGFSTLLMDLNMALGGVETLLGVTPPTTLANLLPVIEELDSQQLETATVQQGENLDILCSPCSSSVTGQFNATHADRLLSVARQTHQVTVLDMPTTLSPTGLAELRNADQIAYLLTADPLAVHTLASVLSALELGGVPRDHVGVVHRLRGPAAVEIAGSELARQFALPLLGMLPHDWTLAFRSTTKNKVEPWAKSRRYTEEVERLSIRMAVACGLSAPMHKVVAPQRGGLAGLLAALLLPALLKGGR